MSSKTTKINKKHTVVASFTNLKGGTLKSSSCNTIGNGLANLGYKVLMIDMDSSQNNLSLISTGNEQYYNKAGIQDVLLSYINSKKDIDRIEISEVIQNIKPNLDICTATIDLMGVELMIAASNYGRELILKKALKELVDNNIYDFILFDLAPSINQLTINCYVASNILIVPCSTTFLSYKGLTLLEDSYQSVKENLNPNLNLYGIIATLVNQTNHSKEILQKLKESEYKLLGTIPQTVQGADVVYSHEKNIMDFAPESKLGKSYQEVINKISEDYDNGTI